MKPAVETALSGSWVGHVRCAMNKSKSLYHGHRFPASVINCAVCRYFRFQLSLRDIEELLFERVVTVTYEAIRCWCDKFGKGSKTEIPELANGKSESISRIDGRLVRCSPRSTTASAGTYCLDVRHAGDHSSGLMIGVMAMQ
jgi:hypothetical protein